jgi:predicted nucleic acid-binding protein
LPGDEEQPPLLLDTTVLTYLTDPRNRHPEWDDVVRGRTLVLSFVTVGEILHATMMSGWNSARIADVEARLRAYPVIPGTIGVSRKYAELRRWYWKQIGENDLWIAACALAQPERVQLATADGDYSPIVERFPLDLVGPPTPPATSDSPSGG